MLGLIAILVAAGDASLPGAKAMADACTSAVTEGTCVVIPSGAETGESKAVATVSWSEGLRQTALILVVPAGGKGERQRRLVFAPTDPEIERWKAVGFAVATLVGEAPRQSDPRRDPPHPEALPLSEEDPFEVHQPGKTPAPLTPALATSRGVTLALNGFMAGVTRGNYMLGSSLRGGVLSEGPIEWGLEIAAGLLPAGGRSEVAGNLWWVGPLARWHLADRQSIHPVASFAFQLERQIVEAERGPYFAQQKIWQVVGSVGLGLSCPVWRGLSIEADVNMGVRSGSTIIMVQGKDLTDIPRFKAVVALGVVGAF